MAGRPVPHSLADPRQRARPSRHGQRRAQHLPADGRFPERRGLRRGRRLQFHLRARVEAELRGHRGSCRDRRRQHARAPQVSPLALDNQVESENHREQHNSSRQPHQRHPDACTRLRRLPDPRRRHRASRPRRSRDRLPSPGTGLPRTVHAHRAGSSRDCQELRVCEAVIRKAGTVVLAGKDH